MSALSDLLNPSVGTESPSDVSSTPGEPNTSDAASQSHPMSVTEMLISRSNQEQEEREASRSTEKQRGTSQVGGHAGRAAATKELKHAKSSETDHARSYQTLLINARSRHLKKNDGEPYWRNEIQFAFIMELLFNHFRVFKNPYYGTPEGFDWPEHFKVFKDSDGKTHPNDGQTLTFFELYLVTLLKSSKISKILKARLMLDINYALNFTVISLLVNIGRLNTTVNFDYEMRSQFRTYHSIPSLQVGSHFQIIEKFYPQEAQKLFEDPENKGKKNKDGDLADDPTPSNIRNGSGYTISTVKQLQDTPRIKSILKSINELSGNIPKKFPAFIEAISQSNHTFNIISIIFMICTHEYEIGQAFFPFENGQQNASKSSTTGSLLNDIWLRPKLNSSDKVRKFLWLIYTIVETKLDVDKILQNPFNEPAQSVELCTALPSANIANELKDVHHKMGNHSSTIVAMADIIPKWRSSDSEHIAYDPLFNDFDTPEEVDFAGQMKNCRFQFVEHENQNLTITNVHGNQNSEEKAESDQVGTLTNSRRNRRLRVENNTGRDSSNVKIRSHGKSRRSLRQKTMESATSDYGFSSNTNSGKKIDKTYYTSVLDSFGVPGKKDIDDDNDSCEDDHCDTPGNRNKRSCEEMEGDEVTSGNMDDLADYNERSICPDNMDPILSAQLNNLQRFPMDNEGSRRPNDDSVELSATDPLPMSVYEENPEDINERFFNYGYSGVIVNDYKHGEHDALQLTSCVRKRKNRKQAPIEPAIKNTVNMFDAYFNRDNKSAASSSKNAIIRREKYLMISQFIFDLIKEKQVQARILRHHEGNWKHFTKHLWDLNIFVEKEQAEAQEKFADWGEFKTTMMKVFNQVNCVIGERLKVDKVMGVEPSTERQDTFLDDIFSQLEE